MNPTGRRRYSQSKLFKKKSQLDLQHSSMLGSGCQLIHWKGGILTNLSKPEIYIYIKYILK